MVGNKWAPWYPEYFLKGISVKKNAYYDSNPGDISEQWQIMWVIFRSKLKHK